MQRRAEQEDSVMELDVSDADLVIEPDDLKALKNLGFSAEDLGQLAIDEVPEILDRGLTKKQWEEASQQRADAIDAMYEQWADIIADMEKSEQQLRNQAADLESKHDALLEQIEAVSDQLEETPDDEELKAKRRSLEEAINFIVSELDSVTSVIRSFDAAKSATDYVDEKLIDQLADANDAASATPGIEDDDLVVDLVQQAKDTLDLIEKLRSEVLAIRKKQDSNTEAVFHARKLLDKAPLTDRATRNVLKRELKKLEAEAKSLASKLSTAVMNILQKEEQLKDLRVEQKILDVLEQNQGEPKVTPGVKPQAVPPIEDIKKQVEKEVAPDPKPDPNVAPKMLMERSEKLRTLALTYSKDYEQFIRHRIAPDIPSDPKIDAEIQKINAKIISRALKAKEAVKPFMRNPMHRTAMLTIPSLYEYMANVMNASLIYEDDDGNLVEARAIYTSLLEGDLEKDAISFKDFGKNVLDKGVELSKSLFSGTKDLVKQINDWREKTQYAKKDLGSRRESPKDKRRRVEKELSDIRKFSNKIKQSIAAYRKALRETRDPAQRQLIQQELRQLNQQLVLLGEQREGIDGSPLDGAMAAEEKKRFELLEQEKQQDDVKQLQALLPQHKAKLVPLLRDSFPRSEKAELEILRHSEAIRDTANTLGQFAAKHTSEYPHFRQASLAYSLMFSFLHDTLMEALRPGG
tara:strand:+ start:181350 stop:183425 length:2076 start_codon:yes stop_codon:yes gene_type:complete